MITVPDPGDPTSGADFTAMDAVQLRALIGARELSPVALLEQCIERIETINPAINAITATCFARARVQARRAETAVLAGEDLGALHGLPLAVKDLEDTAGLLTTRGSPLLRENVPGTDAIAVARLREAGAIVIGKTNVPEWGAGANSRNPVWGATGNPFQPLLNAGGSSGGSAAALACDLVPLATGSDTGGSLRIPAALCGVVGFRPSPGLIPADRRELGWSPISVLGPMGRTVAETRLQFTAMVGADRVDPLTYPTGPAEFAAGGPIDLAGLRVAYSEDFGVCPVDPGIRETFRERIEVVRGLVRVCESIDLAGTMADADRCFDIIRAQGFVTGFDEIYRREPALLGPNVRANYEIGAAMTLIDAGWAHREQTRIFRRWAELYADYDVVLAPVTPVSPFPWTTLFPAQVDGVPARNYYHWLGLTYLVTLTTCPALSLPTGTDRQGMPFGLQLIGAHRGDAALLDIAQAFETALAAQPGLGRPVPDIGRLSTPVVELLDPVTAPPPPDLVSDHGR